MTYHSMPSRPEQKAATAVVMAAVLNAAAGRPAWPIDPNDALDCGLTLAQIGFRLDAIERHLPEAMRLLERRRGHERAA